MTDTPQDPYAGAAPGSGAGAGPGTYPGGGYPAGGPYPAGGYPGGPQAGPYPPYGYPYPPMQAATNTLAILALVFAFVFAPAAIVMGVIARKQIRRTGEQGMGLATAGMIVGIVFTVLSAIWIIGTITLVATAMHHIHEQNSTSGALVMARAYIGL